MKEKKVAGIICEYNPFHNGHAYQIDEIRRRGYDTVVCVMSGNTVQRGEFAIFDKYTRAKCALLGGADLVVELPFPYSSSSGEYFANAGVRLLDSVGVDAICFGSENGSLQRLMRVAQICLSEKFKDEYRAKCISESGTAAAYFEAYRSISGEDMPDGANDILGISYLKAMMKFGCSMNAEVIKREGCDYRQCTLPQNGDALYPSASMLREEIYQNCISERIKNYIPQEVFAELEMSEPFENISMLDRGVLAFFRLYSAAGEKANPISDAGGGILEKICKVSHNVHSYRELVEKSAVGKYTHSRIKRAILYSMIGVTEEDVKRVPQYSTVLGFNSKGRALLSEIRKTSKIPLVTKPSDAPALGEGAARQCLISNKADAIFTLLGKEASESSSYITRSPIIV